jgi:LSD1 subclass zinc finger protein
MEVKSVACRSCGAPVDVPRDADQVRCVYCGTTLAVERGQGYVALKTAQEMSRSIRDSTDRTQEAIRQSTTVTQVGLRRLQLSQELSAAQMQLSNIQAEIRGLERQKQSRRTRQHLQELRPQQRVISQRIAGLQAALSQMPGNSRVGGPNAAGSVMAVGYGTKDWAATLGLSVFLGFFGVHRLYTGHIVIGIIQFLTAGGFGIWWLIDVLLIISGRYRDSRGYLLQDRKPAVASGCLPALIVCAVITFLGFLATADNPDASIGVLFAAIVLGALVFFFAYRHAREKQSR